MEWPVAKCSFVLLNQIVKSQNNKMQTTKSIATVVASTDGEKFNVLGHSIRTVLSQHKLRGIISCSSA